MTREIKFRVWDTMEKRYIYPDKGYQAHFVLTLKGKFYNLQNGSGGDEYIVQQYTGHKDANGKEIYEGDFLRLHRVLLSQTEKELIGGVLNNGTDFCLKRFVTYYSKPRYELFPLTSELFNNRVEVIGNIFENKDLL